MGFLGFLKQIIRSILNRRSNNAEKHPVKLDLPTTFQEQLIKLGVCILKQKLLEGEPITSFRLCTCISFNPSKPCEAGRAITAFSQLREQT